VSGKRYPEKFKIEAVKQVTGRGYKIGEVARRLGVTTKNLRDWIKKFGVPGRSIKPLPASRINFVAQELQLIGHSTAMAIKFGGLDSLILKCFNQLGHVYLIIRILDIDIGIKNTWQGG
jgi:hypothetical protein